MDDCLALSVKTGLLISRLHRRPTSTAFSDHSAKLRTTVQLVRLKIELHLYKLSTNSRFHLRVTFAVLPVLLFPNN